MQLPVETLQRHTKILWIFTMYIQLKEMPQDRDQWRRKTIKWSSAVANRHRWWSTSKWVSDIYMNTYTYPIPQLSQQLRRSSAEMCAWAVPLDAMQIRSDIASTAPNAWINNHAENSQYRNMWITDKLIQLHFYESHLHVLLHLTNEHLTTCSDASIYEQPVQKKNVILIFPKSYLLNLTNYFKIWKLEPNSYFFVNFTDRTEYSQHT